MTKKELLTVLKNNTYCRIKESKIHGIGVVAIRPIPKGVDPFCGIRPVRWHAFEESDLAKLDPKILRFIDDFCPLKNNKYLIPEYGLSGMDMSFYMNTSRKPNIMSSNNGESFVTMRRILPGEELTVDYKSFSEQENII